ncbi:E3 ubiquitin-protein ligase TRIM39-like [Discoglossus pictus]
MAVANHNPINELQEELTCPICLDHFKDPVSIDCGHSFCRHCISRTWRGIHSNFSCPQCRKTSKWKFLRPNRLVENVVEILNNLLAAKEKECSKKLCKKHQEPIKLYCRVDEEGICLVCRESVDHRTHTVIPIEESTTEFKVQLGDRLQMLKKEAASIIKSKAEEQKRAETLQNQVGQKRKILASEFEALRLILADQERALTDRLAEMEQTIIQSRNKNLSRLNEKLSSVEALINDIEKNGGLSTCQEPQELKNTLIRNSPQMRSDLRRKCSVDVSSSLPACDYMKMFTVPVTLNHKTASPNIHISGNRKVMRYEEHPKDIILYPESFDMKPCALGTTGYKSGKRYWETEVGGGIYWTIGVAKQSIRRKGQFKIEPSGGIWAVGLLGMYTDRYYAFTNPDTLLNPREPPVRIGVFLNCDESYLSFYNADSMEHLFTFTPIPLMDKLFPFFCVGAIGTELKLDF